MATISQRGIPRPDVSPTAQELSRPGVYLIHCKSHNVGYIGSARFLRSRYTHHWADFNRGSHPARELQRIYDTEGVDAFEFRILATLDSVEAYDREMLALEGEWIARLGSTIRLINKNTAGSEVIEMPMTLNGRMVPIRSRSRAYLMAHPEIVDQQIALWQRIKAAISQ